MPSRKDLAQLGVGVVAVGTSGPLIAASTVPIPSLIMWRNALSAVATAPFAIRDLRRQRAQGRSPARSTLLLSAFSGVLLAAHFLGFFAAMRMTSVAAGTALVALQPVFAALMAKSRGHFVPAKAWLGMAIALVGVLAIGGVDYSLSTRALLGDLAAIAAAFLGAAYVSVVSEVRTNLSTSIHTTICYSTTAGIMIVVSLLTSQPLWGYSGREWLIIAGLIFGAQLLGHTVFNHVLKTTSATVVSLIVLFETPVAALIAALWLSQFPPPGIYLGMVLLLAGSALVVSRVANPSIIEPASTPAAPPE
jgi:drug/metabolite transporter (DMT)-like permease